MKIKRNRNATITDIRRAWIKKKIRELGEMLRELPGDRRDKFESDILAQPQSTEKGTQAK